VAQATFEVEAEYKKNLDRDYHKTPEGAEGGAHFFEPMLAQKYEPHKFTPGFAQPKLDGIRCIVSKKGAQVLMTSREGKPFFGAPHIIEELAAVRRQSRPDARRRALQSRPQGRLQQDRLHRQEAEADAEQLEESRRLVQYHVYDMPSSEGWILEAPSRAQGSFRCL
jgi:DNA ligase-1